MTGLPNRSEESRRRVIVSAPVSSGGLYSHFRNILPRILSLRPRWEIEVHSPADVLETVFNRADLEWMRPIPDGGRNARLRWEFIELPKFLRADRRAVLFAPFGPFWNVRLARRAVVRLENMIILLDPGERVVSRTDVLRYRILRHVYFANARRARIPACASIHSRDRYVEMTGLQPERFAVIPHGVDMSLVESAEPDPEIDRLRRKGPFVLTIGQATPYRRTRELIRAYRILAERSDETLPPLYWAGSARREDFEYERECLDLLQPLVRRGKALHLGHLTHHDVFALNRSATLFVHPSVHEDCPNTIFEALAAGAPVICTDIPANREFVDPAAHFITETTPAAIAGAIEALLCDPSKLEALRRAGRERARMMSWDDTARGVVSALEEAFSAQK